MSKKQRRTVAGTVGAGLAAVLIASTLGVSVAPAAAEELSTPLASHVLKYPGGGSALSQTTCDVNGDNKQDLLVGNWGWTRAPYGAVGAAWVVLGQDELSEGNLDSLTDSEDTIRIGGPSSSAGVGSGVWQAWSVSCLGDTNGDGIDDVVIGTGNRQYHKVAVVFGSTNFTNIDVDQLGDQGYLIEDTLANDVTSGDNSTDNFGYWVSAVGDVDGDGLADIAISDLLAERNGLTNSGRVWIVKGKRDAENVDVNDTDHVYLTVDGEAAQDRLATVTPAGDVNGDNIDDFIIGSYVADPWGTSIGVNAGEGYVVFGGASAESIDLSTTSIGDRGFSVLGPQRGSDRLGISASSIGDINDDGKSDVILGAGASSGNGGAAIVYGSESIDPVMTNPAATDLSVYSCADGSATIDCTDSTKVNRGYWVEGEGGVAGFGVAGIGDLNGDDLPDAVIGAYGRASAYVVYSNPAQQTALNLATLTEAQGEVFTGVDGRVVSTAGDLDGNGYADFASAGNGGTLNVILRGPLKTGVAVTQVGDTVAGGPVVLNVDARSLVSGASVAPSGTVTVTVDGETIDEYQYTSGDEPRQLSFTPGVSGSYAVSATFTSVDSSIFSGSSVESPLEVAKRVDGKGSFSLDGRIIESGDTVEASFVTTQELTGEVAFFVDSSEVARAALVDGEATAQLTGLAAGKYQVKAVYLGDQQYASFTSKELSLRVEKVDVDVPAPTLSARSLVYGSGSVTASATVPGAQAGTVTFYDNGKVLGKANIGADGKAAIVIATPVAGIHDIAVKYNGGGELRASGVSDEVRLTVTKATSSKVTVSGKAFKKGTKPKVTVNVAKLSNGSYPVGKVTVTSGSYSKTVTLKAANKGKITVTLGKKFSKKFKVRATFTAKDAVNVAHKNSQRVTIKVKK